MISVKQMTRLSLRFTHRDFAQTLHQRLFSTSACSLLRESENFTFDWERVIKSNIVKFKIEEMLKKSVISITDFPGWDYSGEGEREIHQIQGNVQA